jgi:putative transcriptional regulator
VGGHARATERAGHLGLRAKARLGLYGLRLHMTRLTDWLDYDKSSCTREVVGITPQNLSVLKTGKARAIRFGTLEKLCEILDCQPGDLLAFEKDAADQSDGASQKKD